MNIRHTIIKATVAATMVASMIAPVTVGAVTAAELQVQINALLAQLQMLQGQTPGTPAVCVGVTFIRNLTVGSMGSDVRCLQALLNTSASTRVAVSGAGSPGMETTYFGARTLVAVKVYQSQQGWTPANQVGPMTRAKLNAWITAGVPGTPATPGVPTGLTGTASIKAVNKLTSYSSIKVGEGQSDVIVLGKEVEMDPSGNARIQQVRLKFDRSVGTNVTGSSTRLQDYAKEVKVWLQGKVIGSAMTSDFTRDSSGVYSKTIVTSGILDSGVKSNLTVSVSGNDTIDSGDVTEVWGVNIENIRYVDATGAVITDSTTGDLETQENLEFVTLATSADLQLKFTQKSDNPSASTVRVSTTTDSSEIVLLSFSIKAQGDRLWVDELPVAITTSDDKVSDVVSRIMLKLGGTTFTKALTGTCTSASNCTVTFDKLATWISGDQTIDAQVVIQAKKVDLYAEGATVEANFTATERGNAVAEDKSGSSIASGKRTGVIDGEALTLRSKGITLSGFSSSAVANVDTNGKNQKQTFTVNFSVTAFGDDAYIPNVVSRESSTTAGLIFLIENSSNVSQVPPSVLVSNGTLTSSATLNASSLYHVPDGQTKTFSATIELTDPTTAGFYRIQLDKVQYDPDSTDTTPDNSQSFTPANRFETDLKQVDL